MNQPDQIPQNSFMAVLQRKEINDGLLTHASKILAEAALAAKATGKKATVTLTLTLEPEKGAMSVGAAVFAKTPPQTQDSLTIFWVDKDGALVRDNPEQKELPLRSLGGGANETAATTEAAVS